MSIIGLLDWDLLKWRQPTCFNLELMKLSTYYKNYSHDIVIMANDFDLSRYSKIFIQKVNICKILSASLYIKV